MVRLIKVLGFLCLLGVLGVVAASFAKRSLDHYFNRGVVETPPLVGLELEEALLRSRLTVKPESKAFSSKIPAGHIISQDPLPGTPVNPNRTIRVVLSRGADTVDVPDLVGLPLRKARLDLSAVALQTGHQTHILSQRPAGTVLGQYPLPGKPLAKGGKVDLLMSAGPRTGPVRMPRLLGLSRDEARRVLSDMGLSERLYITERPFSGVEEDAVVEQQPTAGTLARSSDTIHLMVARQMDRSGPVRKEIPVSFEMPPGLTSKILEVYQRDDSQGRRRIYSRAHGPTEHVQLTVKGAGRIVLEFYVDETFYGRKTF